MPLDIAASKIGVSVDRLQVFESGMDLPTVTQLRKIGRVYRKPAAFFYLTRFPQKPDRLEDFRSFPGVSMGQSPALIDAVSRALERRLDAIELTVSLDRSIPNLELIADVGAPPEQVASAIRQRVGIDLSTQQTWREPYTALRSWINAVERCGILVVQFSNVEVREARGFSLAERPYPVIALNGSDWPRAKIFTLFHEFVHIALSASGICDLHDESEDPRSIERLCNRIAAEALVPSEALLTDPIVMRHRAHRWDDADLGALSVRYAVSREVILRRLLTLGRTTVDFYREKRREFTLVSGEEEERSGGFLPPFRRVLRDNGTAFTSLTVDAYRREIISSLSLSRLLGGVNLKHLNRIEEALSTR